MLKLYRKFHYLSLDIVAGALASSFFLARLFEARPGWMWFLALGISVWILYMGDHLVDAWRHRKKGLRPMHYFLFQHRRPLLYAMGIVLIADFFLVFNLLNPEILRRALLLSVLVFLFYAMRHVFRRNRLAYVPGELFVLLFYLAGTALGPLIMRGSDPGTSQLMVLLMLALVLLMNLGIISLYDAGLDSRLGIASLAHVLGKKACKSMVLISGIAVLMLAVLQFMIDGSGSITRLGFVPAGMALILLLVLYSPSYFRRNESYRLTADAVLYLGFLALLV